VNGPGATGIAGESPVETMAGTAEFLRRLSSGLNDGLDPVSAAERAAVALPKTLRDSVERISRRMAGRYHEDEWGFDEEFAEAVYPFFDFLYEVWWRVQATGVDNLPSHGRALVVSNHSGSLFPFDASMLVGAIMKEHPLPRWPRPMVLNWAFELPFLSFFMRKVGGVPASPFNAIRLLEQDEIVMVFPEGVKGTGKPFSERYRLQRFGRGGFVEVALRTGSPIIPVAVVGAEEIYPKLAESKTLAKLLGAPFVPITPTLPWLGPLGLIPLPSRWRIEFCEPIDLSEYPPDAADDRALLFEISERVRDTIQEQLYEALVRRGSAFM
jgi:1-acyl-sn-glycerol-3-phosphate acyltransferase